MLNWFTDALPSMVTGLALGWTIFMVDRAASALVVDVYRRRGEPVGVRRSAAAFVGIGLAVGLGGLATTYLVGLECWDVLGIGWVICPPYSFVTLVLFFIVSGLVSWQVLGNRLEKLRYEVRRSGSVFVWGVGGIGMESLEVAAGEVLGAFFDG